MMSETHLSLRLTGDLPPLEELTRQLGHPPTFAGRRGTPSPLFKRTVPSVQHRLRADVWLLDLVAWEGVRAPVSAMAEATATLRRLAPMLASLERPTWKAQLYISSIRREEQGGFDLPMELLVAAGEARLECVVSILVGLLEEEEEEEESDE